MLDKLRIIMPLWAYGLWIVLFLITIMTKYSLDFINMFINIGRFNISLVFITALISTFIIAFVIAKIKQYTIG